MTILVAANDVCLKLVIILLLEYRFDSNQAILILILVIRSCSGDVQIITAESDDFEKNTREMLKEVRKNIPKLSVNLVLLGNISEV